MFSQTIKSVIKIAKSCAGSSIIEIEAENQKVQRTYSFTITKDSIVVKIKQGSLEGIQEVADIEMLALPSYLNVTRWKETLLDNRGGIYEEQVANLHYDAQLYIKLFRLMRERVYFSMKLQGAYIDAYYLEGKVLYIKEDDITYSIIGTDLYQLAQVDRDYRVLNVDRLPANLDYRRFIDDHRTIANSLGKEFLLHKPERAV